MRLNVGRYLANWRANADQEGSLTWPEWFKLTAWAAGIVLVFTVVAVLVGLLSLPAGIAVWTSTLLSRLVLRVVWRARHRRRLEK
jgi:hypothetical protein